MYRLGLGLGTGNGFYFFCCFKKWRTPYAAMQGLWRMAMWCMMYCGFHPAPSSPTPSVGHVTGDMKRRENNETQLTIDTEDGRWLDHVKAYTSPRGQAAYAEIANQPGGIVKVTVSCTVLWEVSLNSCQCITCTLCLASVSCSSVYTMPSIFPVALDSEIQFLREVAKL